MSSQAICRCLLGRFLRFACVFPAAGASARQAADEGATASLLGGAAGGNITGAPRAGGGASGLGSNRRSTPLYTTQGRLRGGMVHSQGFENPEAMFELLRRENPEGLKHDWKMGMGWMKEWDMGEEWLEKCMKGVLQYVVMQGNFTSNPARDFLRRLLTD